MANDINFVIRARNTAQAAVRDFARGLREGAAEARRINRETRAAAKEARRLAEETRKAEQAAARAAARANLLHVNMRKAAAAAGSIVGGIVAFASFERAIRDAIGVAITFEETLSEIKAVGQVTAAQMKDVENAVRDLGATTSFSAAEAGEGVAFLVRAGFEIGDALDAIPTALDLAKAGMLDLGSAADIASNILTAARLEVNQFADVADVLATAAASTNVNIEQLGASFRFFGPTVGQFGIDMREATSAIGLLGNAGIQGALAGSSLRGMFARLVKPTKQAEEALAEVGLSARDLNPETKSLAQIIKTLTDANLNATQSATIFGTEVQGVVDILTNAYRTGAFTNLMDIMADNEGALKNMSITMGDNLGGAIKELRSAIEEFYLSLVNNGALTQFVQFLTAMVRAVTPARAAFEGMVDGSRDAATYLKELQERADELRARFATFADAAQMVVRALASFAQLFIVLRVFKLLGGTIALITYAITEFGPQIKTMVQRFLEAIGPTGQLIAAVTALSFAFRLLLRLSPVGWIVLIVEAIRQLMDVTFEWEGATLRVGDVVKKVFDDVGVWIGDMVASAKRWFTDFGTAASAMFDGFIAAAGRFKDWLVGWAETIGSLLTFRGSIEGPAYSAFPQPPSRANTSTAADLILPQARAVGGPIEANKSYLVGEKGPELITTQSDGYVYTAAETRAIMEATRAQARVSADAVNASSQGIQVASNAGATVTSYLTSVLDDMAATSNAAKQAEEQAKLMANDTAAQRAAFKPTTTPVDGTGGNSGADGADGNNGRLSGSRGLADAAANAERARDAVAATNGQLTKKSKFMTEILASYQQEILKATLTGDELFRQTELEKVKNDAKTAGIALSQQELDLILQQADAARKATDFAKARDEVAGIIKGGVGDAIKEALNGGDVGGALASFGQTLRDRAIDGLVSALLDNTINNLIGNLFGGLGSGGGGGGGFLAGIFSNLFAKGGIMTDQGPMPLRQYQRGGIARSPQLAMFGEGATPEAYVPVPSGRIPVEMPDQPMTSGPTNITINVTAKDADSFRRSMPQLQAETQRALARQGSRGQ